MIPERVLEVMKAYCMGDEPDLSALKDSDYESYDFLVWIVTDTEKKLRREIIADFFFELESAA